jgi:hypothetical protein
MQLSSMRTPKWWQRAWNRRFPTTADGLIIVIPPDGDEYVVRPMRCGCGYRVFAPGDFLASRHMPGHSPTIRGAMRRVRKHYARSTS